MTLDRETRAPVSLHGDRHDRGAVDPARKPAPRAWVGIAFIGDQRGALGVDLPRRHWPMIPDSTRSLPLASMILPITPRPIKPMPRDGAIRCGCRHRQSTIRALSQKSRARTRRSSRPVAREGLAAVAARRPRIRTLQGRASDANHGVARSRAWQAGQNPDQRKGGAMAAEPRQRQFQATRPNALWLLDLTSIASATGFVHAAFHRYRQPSANPRSDISDAGGARRIVGWRVSRTATRGSCSMLPEQALHDRRPRRRSGGSSRPRRPIHGEQIHRAPGRRRNRAIRQQRLRQRVGRDHHWPCDAKANSLRQTSGGPGLFGGRRESAAASRSGWSRQPRAFHISRS